MATDDWPGPSQVVPKKGARGVTPSGATAEWLPLRMSEEHWLSDRRSGRKSDSYRFSQAMLFILLAVTADVTNFLDRGTQARYLLAAVPFLAVLVIRLGRPRRRLRRPSLPDLLLVPLWIFVLLGSVTGKLFRHTPDSALSISIPMTVAFVYLWTVERESEEEAGQLLRALAWIGFLYICLNALANSGHGPQFFVQASGKSAFRNSQILYVALGFAAAISARHWGRLAILLGLGAIIFLGYPSGTSAVVALVTVTSLYMTRPRASRKRPFLVGMTVITVALFALINFAALVNLTNHYFAAVGKQNDNGGRLAAWQAGVQKFLESPIYGDGFTGDTTVFVIRRQGLGAPLQGTYNSDYVLIMVLGGAVGLILLLGWYGVTEATILRRYRSYIDSGQPQHAALLRALLVGFNAYAAAALFNPLLNGASRTATLFAIYSLMMCVGNPETTMPIKAGLGMARSRLPAPS